MYIFYRSSVNRSWSGAEKGIVERDCLLRITNNAMTTANDAFVIICLPTVNGTISKYKCYYQDTVMYHYSDNVSVVFVLCYCSFCCYHDVTATVHNCYFCW